VAVKTGIGDSMRVTAGDEVRLGPGFSTEEDATFRATVDTSQSTAESAETPDWRLTFLRYDREGQVTRKDAFVPGLGQVTYTYRYDRQERLTRRRVHLRRAGQTVHQWYEYDRRGQVRAVYASRDSVKPKSPEVAYRYAADGQVEETTWKGGPSFSRAYNRRGWLTAIGTVDSSQAFAARYRYFPDGNVKAVTASPKTYSTFTRTYRYDALDRLTSADYGADGLGGEYDVTDLTYDPNGNITGLTRYGRNEPNVDDSVLVDRLSYDRYEGNRLMHVRDAAGRKTPWDAGSGRFAYDPAGRMLRSPAPMGLAAAAYDEQGLPETMALKNEADVRFRYTAGGQRTYKQVDGGRGTHYVRDGSVPVAVVDGGRLRYWTLTLPGGEGIGRMPAGGGRRYYVTDHLGSIRAVLDGGGNVKETRDYYPFGLRMPGRTTQKSPTETEEDFTGHVKDDATGLHYAGARYYSSAFGRWTTTEPLLQSKSPKKLLKNKPRLLTRTSYNYTFNNPINLRDPTGKVACGGLCTAALVAAGGAAVGAAVEAGTQYWQKGEVNNLGKVGVSAAKGGAIALGGHAAGAAVSVFGAATAGAALTGASVEGIEGFAQGQSIGRMSVDAFGTAAAAAAGGALGQQLGKLALKAGVAQKLSGQLRKLAGSKSVKKMVSKLNGEAAEALGKVGKEFLKGIGAEPGAKLTEMSTEGIGAAVVITLQTGGGELNKKQRKKLKNLMNDEEK
jgi:RHS repeat-associated protein